MLVTAKPQEFAGTGSGARPPGRQVHQTRRTQVLNGMPLSGIDTQAREALAGEPELSSTLNPELIRVLNWNIQKQISPTWRSDLERLCRQVDLALLQEVHLADDFLACFEHRWCHSFTQGWSTRNRMTGVATLAAVGHLSHNQLVCMEPLLRTPKATNITTYPLADSKDELLVINLHAVNFCLGMRAYQEQLRGIVDVAKEHRGPIIFAGDFNTWHPGRERLIREVARMFGMEEVLFEEDHRTRVFGKCLDYIFTRGLKTLDAHSRPVASSDHNPLLATFTL